MTKEKESLIIAADKADDDSKPEFVKEVLGRKSRPRRFAGDARVRV